MQSAAVDIFAISFPFELLRQRNSSRGNREEQCNVKTEVLRQVVAELGIREAQRTGKQVTKKQGLFSCPSPLRVKRGTQESNSLEG